MYVSVAKEKILGVCSATAKLCLMLESKSYGNVVDSGVEHALTELFDGLVVLGANLGVDIADAVKRKMKLNNRKYKATLVLASKDIKKYTEYSAETGIKTDSEVLIITKDERIAAVDCDDCKAAFVAQFGIIMEDVRKFAIARNWLDAYTVKEVVLSLYCEIGELAEVLSWKNNERDLFEISTEKFDVVDRLARELADIAIYGFHLCRILSGGMDVRILESGVKFNCAAK